MSGDRSRRSELTIARHVALSAGAGAIPLPVADYAVLTAVQINLVRRLCAIYGVPFSREAAKALVAGLLGAAAPGLSFAAASSLKTLPGAGTLAGLVSAPALAAAATFAAGQVFRHHLETGGSLLTFDANRMKAEFDRRMQEADAARAAAGR